MKKPLSKEYILRFFRDKALYENTYKELYKELNENPTSLDNLYNKGYTSMTHLLLDLEG